MSDETQIELASITIDGRSIEVPRGTGMVEAALGAGIEIPVFCYEPRLGPPLGACRMCLCELEGVPVLSLNGTTAKVNVGSVAHPMDPDHYIVFIELLTAARIYRAELSPGKAPEASFDVHGEVIGARAYCNKHGLWKNQ